MNTRNELRHVAAQLRAMLATFADLAEIEREQAHTPEQRRNARHAADESRYLRTEIGTFLHALDNTGSSLETIGAVIARLDLRQSEQPPAARHDFTCDTAGCLAIATHVWFRDPDPDRDPRYYCTAHAPGDAYTVAL